MDGIYEITSSTMNKPGSSFDETDEYLMDETYYKEKNKNNDDYEVPEFLKKQEEQLKKWKKLASNDKLIAESNNSYFTEEFQKKFLKEREEQLIEMRKLLKKGKNIRLHEIDQFINRYGNTEETRDFINNIAGLKLFKEDNYKNLILDKEEKKISLKLWHYLLILIVKVMLVLHKKQLVFL